MPGGSHYGYTSNMEARMLSLYVLGHDWTSTYRPWAIIYIKLFDTKQKEMVHEKWLKTGAGRAFIGLLPHLTTINEVG
jgi:putative endonuclease